MSPALPSKLTKRSIAKLIVVAALALFVAIRALPQYSAGWAWTMPPKLPQATRTALQAIPQEGIALPGWSIREQMKTEISGHAWSIQQLSAAADNEEMASREMATIFVLLRPQIYEADQPEVEWVDIKGSQRWTTDSYQNISFNVPVETQENTLKDSRTIRINGDFFRAWSKKQTYAVLQWYAWPTGGSASPAQWFWADQKAQWRRHQRMPWIAVNIWLPIDPLGDISPYQPLARSLGQNLQETLLHTIFDEEAADISSTRVTHQNGPSN